MIKKLHISILLIVSCLINLNFAGAEILEYDPVIPVIEDLKKEAVTIRKGEGKAGYRFALSPDARYFAIAPGLKEGTDNNFNNISPKIQVLEVNSGRKFFDIEIKNFIKELSFSPSNKLLAADEYKGPLKLWEIENGKLLKEIPYIPGYNLKFQISNDDKLIGFKTKFMKQFKKDDGITQSYEYFAINICDIATGQQISSLNHLRKNFYDFRFSNDNKSIVSRALVNNLYFWDMANGNLIRKAENEEMDRNRDELLFLDQNKLTNTLLTNSRYNWLMLWNPDKQVIIKEIYIQEESPKLGRFSPDGKNIAIISSGEKGKLKLLDLNSGRITKIFKLDQIYKDIRYTMDGKYLILVTEDGDLRKVKIR